MKKKYIQLGALVLVLAVMVGALVMLRRAPEPAASEAPETQETLYVYDNPGEGAYPQEVDILNEYGVYTIASKETPEQPGDAPTYTISGWETLSLDDYAMKQAAESAKAMVAKRLLVEDATAADLETFGFKNPRATVRASFDGNAVYEVELGGAAPGSEGVYVRLDSGNDIYLVSDSIALPFLKPATAYVNKTVTATDPEFKGFDKLTLSGTDYPEPIVIERTPETATEVEAAGIMLHTHSITSPFNRGVDAQKALEPLSTIYGLLAFDVVAVGDSAETLEEYNLSDPAVIVSAVGENADLTFTLRISKPDAAGNVHLIKDGSPVIYEMPETSFPFIGLSAFDMMEKMVVVPNIKTISQVKLTDGDKEYLFDVKNDDDNVLTVTLNGQPLPDLTGADGKTVTGGENFRKLYQTMIACSYDEPIAAEPSTAATEPADEQDAETVAIAETGESAETADTTESAETAEPSEPESEEPVVSAPASAVLPLASIEYFYNNGRTSDIVRFYEGPPRKVIIELNGSETNYGQSSYLDRLLEDAAKVENGVAVKTYL